MAGFFFKRLSNMGGGSSRLKYIDAQLDAKFRAHCEASATSQQLLELRNVKLTTRDDCTMNFRNTSTVNSACDMGPILDAVAEMSADADETFVRALQALEDRGSTEATSDVTRMKIRRHLDSKCSAVSNAQQTLVLKGLTLACDGNSTINFGNVTDVRADCIRTLLHEAHDLARPPAPPVVTAAKAVPKKADDDPMLMIIAFLACAIVIALLLR
tara:strand:+ start:1560 stop:2201 length:642 start_codon:yes stop_codon:yes gene_type:complete